MTRKKKISIKYFLNKRLKPDSFGRYPLYFRVNYDKNNTQFKFTDFDQDSPDTFLSEKSFNELGEEGLRKKFDTDFIEDLLIEVIRYEDKLFKDEFHLSGLSERMYFYRSSVNEIISNDALKDFKGWLRSSVLSEEDFDHLIQNRYRNNMQYVVFAVYGIHPNLMERIPKDLKLMLTTNVWFDAFTLTNDFEFSTVLDWIIREGREKFNTYLKNACDVSVTTLNDVTGQVPPILRPLAEKLPIKEEEIGKCLQYVDNLVFKRYNLLM